MLKFSNELDIWLDMYIKYNQYTLLDSPGPSDGAY